MEKYNRELSGKEKRAIKKLVSSLCANYDKEYGCLPLECECYMFGICYTGSALCKYFRNAVLPNDKALEAVFNNTPTKPCKLCGKRFPAIGRQVYCSENCAAVARKRATAARVRKYRNRHLDK
ncbi:MAG: hypothetical protein GXZ14_03700 [Ruminococcaceae bacterium]|nr:hypothetical protein [Oscillospiraceae bacterium]